MRRMGWNDEEVQRSQGWNICIFSGKRVFLTRSNYDKTDGFYRQYDKLSNLLHSWKSSVPLSIPIHPSLCPQRVSGHICDSVFVHSAP